MVEATATDWIAKAQQATDPTEIRRCLERAEARADSALDWRNLAAAYRDQLGDAAAAIRCASTAVEHGPMLELWAFHELAVMLRDLRGDRAGAAEVLCRAEAAVDTDDLAQVYMWRMLAEWHASLLDDFVTAARVLDEGLIRADSPRAYCDLAVGYAEILGQHDRARQLLRRAEELASLATDEEPGRYDPHPWWTIANTYSHEALADEAHARQSFERGLALADGTAGCITMAHAYCSHYPEDRDTASRFLARAESFAGSADEWIEVAAAYHELVESRPLCKSCLERAKETAQGESLRRVAHGYRHWLGDPEAAGRIAPRGRAPHELTGRARALTGWQADPGALLDWLRGKLTPEILQSIAEADYGAECEENLAALRDIEETGLIPAPLESNLHEVLALCRWAEGERVDHVERAFACTLLCLDVVQGTGYTETVTDTLPPLLESCAELGDEALRRLVGLLVWLIEAEVQLSEELLAEVEEAEEDEEEWGDDTADLLAAHHALLLAQAALDPLDERLAPLARATIDMEARLAAFAGGEAAYWFEPERGWLCRVVVSLRDDMWRHLTRTIISRALADHPDLPHLQEVADLLGARSTQGTADGQARH